MTTSTVSRVDITESIPLAEAARPADGPGRLLVTIITPGWGSSGYYSTEVLRQAAEDRVFPKGTLMFIDHPTPSENEERPARSVRDIAAVLTEDARQVAGGALKATARVYSQWRNALAEMAGDIGTSIRAVADFELGEVDGRAGRIITRLVEGRSVDFVTVAGRGGKFEVIESARTEVAEARNVGQWVESRIHRDFSLLADDLFGDGRLSREERIALSSAIGDALGAFVSRLESSAPQLYERDLWEDPPAPTQGDADETHAGGGESGSSGEPDDQPHDQQADQPDDDPGTDPDPNVPAPAGSNPTQESREDTMPQIEEAQLRRLEEAAGRVPALEAERDQAVARAQEAERRAAVAENTTRARDLARQRVTEANGELPTEVVDRIVAEATRQIPLTDELRLDVETLNTAADEARSREETYLARIAEASGIGQVRGVGSTEPPQVTQADVDETVAAVFNTKGA